MGRVREPGVSAASGSQVFQEYEVDDCEHDDDGDVYDQSCHEMVSEEQNVYANDTGDHEQKEDHHVHVLRHVNTPFKYVIAPYPGTGHQPRRCPERIVPLGVTVASQGKLVDPSNELRYYVCRIQYRKTESKMVTS
jgi:hypothetical protein